MTQYDNVSTKLWNSQLNKLKNATGIPLTLSKNVIRKNETKISHNLLLTDRQVLGLC